MKMYDSLKAVWKKLGINGQVKNYSSYDLWVLENDTSDNQIARILPPGYKTPRNIDVDAFKIKDGPLLNKHNSWWKFYDFSTIDIYSNGNKISLSTNSVTAVGEKNFGQVIYKNEIWGERLKVVVSVRKNKKEMEYYISDDGWKNFESTLEMVCLHQIDNARPVFPKNRRPYIRSKRDKQTLNNFSSKVLV